MIDLVEIEGALKSSKSPKGRARRDPHVRSCTRLRFDSNELQGKIATKHMRLIATFAIWLAITRTTLCQSPAVFFINQPHLWPRAQTNELHQQQRWRPPFAQETVDIERQQQPRLAKAVQFERSRKQQQQQQVDLVALNMRRFELDHNHQHYYTPNSPRVAIRNDFETNDDFDSDLMRGQQIEAQIAALPERILNRFPEETTKQLVESLSADASLMGLTRQAHELTPATNDEDPDGASIERLTKSCMTVQASSLPADQLNVTFHLYTRRNLHQAYIMGPQVSRDELLTRSPFDARKPLKWITHGFHTNLDKSEWMLATKDKILEHENANVILTDWRRGASPALAFYPKAAANAHVVAKMIIKILRRLLADIELGQVHLIGHSLGAHIMGFVGSAFTEEYLHQQQVLINGGLEDGATYQMGAEAQDSAPKTTVPSQLLPLIGRITACDPALPCFGASSSGPNRGRRPPPPSRVSGGNVSPQQGNSSSLFSADDWVPALWTHLRPDSAVMVEVLHSNPGVMGYAEPLGDFDFYPNGSDRQPGCSGSGGATSTNFAPPPARGQAPLQPQSRPLASRARSSAASRLTQTLGQFIKPIREFFNAYACSHHRSVEYMVESIYSELVPTELRLDPKLVCQMVAYRCQDYQSFKRGFCFTCNDNLECRSFGLSFVLPAGRPLDLLMNASQHSVDLTQVGYTPTLASQFAAVVTEQPPPASRLQRRSAGSDPEAELQLSRMHRTKRILPTLNQYRLNYKPTQRNQYYFDTQATGKQNYCLHHYHLLVKYRWFRIRESVAIDYFRLLGSLNDFSSFAAQQQHQQLSNSKSRPAKSFRFNRFSQHTYTMLITTGDYLGRLDTLLVHENQLKPNLIEYIEVSYLSNLDAQVRSLSSARFCLADSVSSNNERYPELLAQLLDLNPQPSQRADRFQVDPPAGPINVFVRCSSTNRIV